MTACTSPLPEFSARYLSPWIRHWLGRRKLPVCSRVSCARIASPSLQDMSGGWPLVAHVHLRRSSIGNDIGARARLNGGHVYGRSRTPVRQRIELQQLMHQLDGGIAAVLRIDAGMRRLAFHIDMEGGRALAPDGDHIR